MKFAAGDLVEVSSTFQWGRVYEVGEVLTFVSYHPAYQLLAECRDVEGKRVAVYNEKANGWGYCEIKPHIQNDWANDLELE